MGDSGNREECFSNHNGYLLFLHTFNIHDLNSFFLLFFPYIFLSHVKQGLYPEEEKVGGAE